MIMFTNFSKVEYEQLTVVLCVLYYTIVLCDSQDVFTGCLPTSPLFINTTWGDHFLLTFSSLSLSLFMIGKSVHKQIAPRVKPNIFSSILGKTKSAERAWNEIVILHYCPHSRPAKLVCEWGYTISIYTQLLSSPRTASWLGPSLCRA